MADIVVFTQAWSQDHPRKGSEKPNAQIGSRIVIDGEELTYVTGITVDTKDGDFLKAHLHIHPASIRYVSLDADLWSREDLSSLA